MKPLVGAFNQEKVLVGAFSVIVQPVVEPMEHYTALVIMIRGELKISLDRSEIQIISSFLLIQLLSPLFIPFHYMIQFKIPSNSLNSHFYPQTQENM